MTDDEVLKLAALALEHWGGGTVKRLIANRENAVCEVTANGTRAALRLHRAGYQTDAAIRSELLWTDHLASVGFPCPRPVRTVEGALLAEPAFGPRVSLVSWIDAPPFGAMGQAFAGAPDHYHALGQLLANLHRISDAMPLPATFERPHWSIDGLTGETPLWGPFWNNPALSQAERDLLIEARTAAREVLLAQEWDTGLIHADALQENILHSDGSLFLIDFDDGGFGLRLYELGTAMVQHSGTPYAKDLGAALCDGYGGGHEHLELFTLLRALASCGWVIPRVPKGDPRLRIYGQRAVTLAREFLGQP